VVEMPPESAGPAVMVASPAAAAVVGLAIPLHPALADWAHAVKCRSLRTRIDALSDARSSPDRGAAEPGDRPHVADESDSRKPAVHRAKARVTARDAYGIGWRAGGSRAARQQAGASRTS